MTRKHDNPKMQKTRKLAGGEGEKIRKRIAAEVLGEALEALRSDIDIAIYDASNITMQRRRWLSEVVAASGVHSQARSAMTLPELFMFAPLFFFRFP